MRRITLIMTAAALSALAVVPSMSMARTKNTIPEGCSATTSAPVAVEYDTDAANVKLDGTVIVSPPSFRFPADAHPAGITYTCILTIRNRHDARTTLQLEPMGVVGSHVPNIGYEFIGTRDDRWSTTAGPWITPVVRQVTLMPRGVARVPFRIAVPKDPPAGSAAGSINVVSRTRASTGDTAVGVESQVASVVLMPTGDGEADLRVRHVHAPTVRWDRASWPVTADLDNDGTLHTAAQGRIRIQSIFGNEVASLPIPATIVLPGGRERIDTAWERVPWFGLYRWDLRVQGAASGDSSVATSEGWLLALPPWWVLASIGVILVALATRWWLRRGSYDDE